MIPLGMFERGSGGQFLRSHGNQDMRAAKPAAFVLITCLVFVAGWVLALLLQEEDEHSAGVALSRLARPDTAVPALASLLGANDIAGLPPEFNFWTTQTSLNCFDAVAGSGERFRMATVVYPKKLEGQRSYSFVFDETGRCLLHTGDQVYFPDGGLLDLTGDGTIEKIAGLIVSSQSDQEHGKPGFDRRLRVWTIRRPEATLLLDVAYHPRTGSGSADLALARIIPTQDGRSWNIELKAVDQDPFVVISWSEDAGAFVPTRMDAALAEIVFPSQGKGAPRAQSIARQERCQGATCPMCGHACPEGGPCPACGFAGVLRPGQVKRGVDGVEIGSETQK
jgi:hypothetical protein